jgi:SsrA-binding protein
VYLKGRRVKVELGLCRGKQAHDKRQREREREHKRDIERALRERR